MIARLRKLPARDLIKVMMATPTFSRQRAPRYVVDHYSFPSAGPGSSRARGPVPLMVGNTARDGDETVWSLRHAKADATLADKGAHQRHAQGDALGQRRPEQVQAYYAKYGDLAGQAAKTLWRCENHRAGGCDAINAFETDTDSAAGRIWSLSGIPMSRHLAIPDVGRYERWARCICGTCSICSAG